MTPSQCRAARALLDMTQPRLAKAAALGLSTVVDFEKSRRTISEPAVAALQAALEAAGVEFIPENGGGAGVRLRKSAVEDIEGSGAMPVYSATRVAGHETIAQWQGRAPDDEAAAHRLGQHLRTRFEQGSPGYGPDDLITLSRPNGEIVTVARAGELIERLRGWKTAPTADHDLKAD